ncbi:MAG: hypothetical protein HGGPFJEG_02717 [Ignavibacteria bacterium]|nr:hypothetical protein [Ignavibacteria bacterium]
MNFKQIEKRDELGKLFQEYYLKGTGAEVGVKKGKFSRQILKYWKGILLCVDIWEDTQDYEDAKKLLLPDAVLIKGNSKNISLKIEDESLDFVYIDADHRYESVLEDMQSWFPKVRRGGIISGHDYCRYLEHFGVIEAVNDFCRDYGYKEIGLTKNDFWNGIEFPSWYFKK